MTEPLVVEAGELSVDDLLAELSDGRRVIVRAEFLGSEHELTLRHDGDVFYCDTPTTLLKHETPEEMSECLEERGYAQA